MPTLTRAANCRHSPARHWVAICFRYGSSSGFVGRHIVDRRPCRSTNPFELLCCAKFSLDLQNQRVRFCANILLLKQSGKPGSSFSSSTCKYALTQPCCEAGVIAFVLTKYFSWDLLGCLRLRGPCRSHLRQAIILFRSRERLICAHESRTNGCTAVEAFGAECEANCR